jgi:hypothetical protein
VLRYTSRTILGCRAEGGSDSVGTTHAVLIGIETYQLRGIGSVQFAQADAAAMREVLIQDLGVPAENITVWLDSEATKSVFEHELPYVIRQLCPGDRFIFFYAGHGFFANGTNRLTTGILIPRICSTQPSPWKPCSWTRAGNEWWQRCLENFRCGPYHFD